MTTEEYVLIHLSFNYLTASDFKLRVPTHRLKGEDYTVNRISFSETVEGCINSMPDGAKALRGLMKLLPSERVKPIIFGYMVNVTSENQDSFISPPELKRDYGVEDAEANLEHWAIKKPENIVPFIMRINSAVFYEVRSTAGKSKLMVKDIEYDTVDYSLEQLKAIKKLYMAFNEKGVDIRKQALRHDNLDNLTDEQKHEFSRVREIITDELMKFNMDLFTKRKEGWDNMSNNNNNNNNEIMTMLNEIMAKIDRIESKVDLLTEQHSRASIELAEEFKTVKKTLSAHSSMYGKLWTELEILRYK